MMMYYYDPLNNAFQVRSSYSLTLSLCLRRCLNRLDCFNNQSFLFFYDDALINAKRTRRIIYRLI